MSTEDISVDVLVAGGGPAGLIATAAFAARGFRALCVDPAAAPPDPGAPGADLRTTAFLEPAVELMRASGVWDALAPLGADLRVMRIADAGGADNRIRRIADFPAEELGRPRFGVNLPNAATRAALAQSLGARLRAGRRVTGLVPRLTGAVAILDDGTRVRADLVIAADGRDSALRRMAGIGVARRTTGQQAAVFAVSHPEPHAGVSTEIHRTGGPFTLVPLPDTDGLPRSAVVWMDRGPEIRRLMALDAAAFSAEATARSCGILGPLRLEGGRAAWPIVSQIAERFDGPRLALAAEAAHVMPPIGAQGLNTSLADMALILDLATRARAAGEDIGAPRLLTTYARRRRADAMFRATGVDALNSAAQSRAQVIRDLRGAGLAVLSGLPPLRHTAMRLGLGG